VSTSETSLIEGYGVVSLGGEQRQDFPPGIRQFGKSMKADYEFWFGV
jgi:hypothetical protein